MSMPLSSLANEGTANIREVSYIQCVHYAYIKVPLYILYTVALVLWLTVKMPNGVYM